MSSFYIENFGCRATQADGAAIEHQFRELGLDRAPDRNAARYVVLNTCAVTASAEQDARAAIRRTKRQNPGCKIVVTGCYAQRVPAEIAALPGVFAVVGNSHKSNLAQIALRKDSEKGGYEEGCFVPASSLSAPPGAEIFVSDIFAHTELLAAPVFDSANERTRPNLKIQDGCNNRCSFCIIPSLRGRSRSLPLEEVVREINQLVEAEYREVVISGINLGRWGRDLSQPMWGGRPGPPKFEELIIAILDETSLEKLRISSVEPMDWSDSLIQLMADCPRIAKHAHVPLQSGSDAVLRRMHRKYRPWHYREKIEKIRAAMPTAAIGADVMTGFPGETEAEFEETRRMIEDLPFTYLHVFTFSARPGTPAATMPNEVPVRVARERNRILRELAAEKKHAFMRSFIGTPLTAITLSTVNEGADRAWIEALTDNYLKMAIWGRHQSNRWFRTVVEGLEGGELIASVRP
ncbi:MAG: tRNA (N(6)-L-threonylcarbamoyladenosine(37)-C(2))-methylthiotransferase MtaB [Acidobacteria bacterium]|nr:MAG: tRNA (N(6)-L-threonylcarbamoyladenosine(37)-C(2))-methylthiotransferase MtaB [Acidobacteriota bacterium]PYV77907.1 MAG: tRNA (N(6)-L-threonylcarbamoyladenosine(37)-C(2))-methylthiotransferase MtaB [Acidobacteriota bacterium]